MPGTADGLKAAFEKAGGLDKARSLSKHGTSNADIWIALMSEQRAAQPVTA